MSPNKIYFSSPQAAKDIFNTRLDLRKSDYYGVAAPVANGRAVTNLFASTDVHYHDRVRRSVQGLFNMSNVIQYEAAVDEVVTQLLRQLRERFASKQGPAGVVDLPKWLQYFTLDAISTVAYGKPYGFLQRDEDIGGMIQDIARDLTMQTYV